MLEVVPEPKTQRQSFIERHLEFIQISFDYLNTLN